MYNSVKHVESEPFTLQINEIIKKNKELNRDIKNLRYQFSIKENRLYPRKSIVTRVYFGTKKKFFTCYTKNISEGGMLVETKRQLEIGTEVVLTFAIPSFSNPLKIKGKIVWSSS
ncbi:MAG: PilZ domain-containing protein, partial [bacterium]